MSWLFSQALVEAYSGDTSSDGKPSVPLSGNPIPQAYLSQDKMTAFSRLSRFGMTFKPLTENLGKELLMSYLAGFPARTSVLRGGGRHYWKQIRTLERNGKDYWGGTTPVRIH
jgi:hypothetical protein